jgi:hypothetical protein
MKPSSEKPAEPNANRDSAVGYLAANVAIPGTGTFLSGRRLTGVVQTALGLASLGVSMITGTKMIAWMLANWDRLDDPYGDPFQTLQEIWAHIKWPLAAIVLFGMVWIWAVVDSWLVLQRARRALNKVNR